MADDRLVARPSVDELLARIRERKAHLSVRVSADDILAERDADRR